MSCVDVVIPCYNYARYLPQCVSSVLSQEGVGVRVLIIDDCSSDETETVGRELASGDSRVQFHRHATNHGHIATYNEGLLEWASADYFLLLSADDLLIEGALSRAAGLMDTHPEVGLTYGKKIYFSSNNSLPDVPQNLDSTEYTVMSGQQFLQKACQLVDNFIPTPTAVVRTATQKMIGGYRTELPHSGDMEMWLRFGAHASVGVVSAYQAYYRKHSANMSLTYPGVKDHLQLKAAFDTLFTEYGNRIDGNDVLKALTYRNLAEKSFWAAHGAAERGEWVECRELFEYAGALYPGLKTEKSWTRLLWKQKLKKFYPMIRPVIHKIRHMCASVMN